MATKMNSSLWKRKVESEIKDLCERRDALKKLEGEAINKKKSVKDKENNALKTVAN